MKIPTSIFLMSLLLFLTIQHAQAQVDPGNDPVMWSYVDQTQFWIILIVLVIVDGGFTIYFRRKPAPKNNP